MAFSKPAPPAVYNPDDALGTSPGILCGLLAGSGAPTDDVDGQTGAFTTTGGGSAEPAWGTDGSGFPFLGFETNGTALGSEKEAVFSEKGIIYPEGSAGMTLFAVIRPGTNAGGVAGIIISAKADDIGLCITDANDVAFYVGGQAITPPGAPRLNTSQPWAVAITVTPGCVFTCHAANLATGDVQTSSALLVDGGQTLPERAYFNGSRSAVINHRRGGEWCVKGRLYMAGYCTEEWDSAKVSAFFADPWAAVAGVVIPPLVCGALALAGVTSSSLIFTLQAPTGGVEPYGPVRFYESTAPGFSPGLATLVSTVPSPTFPIVFATTLAPNSIRYAAATVADARPTPAVASSNEAAGVVPSQGIATPVDRLSHLAPRSLR